jgi:hypothetical protein
MRELESSSEIDIQANERFEQLLGWARRTPK